MSIDLATWLCFSVLAFFIFTILVTSLTPVIKYLTEATLRRKDLFWLIYFRGGRVHYGGKILWRDCKVAGHIAFEAGSRET